MYYECSLQSLNQLCTVHLEMSGAPSASVINWQNINLDLLNRNNGNIFSDDKNIKDETRSTLPGAPPFFNHFKLISLLSELIFRQSDPFSK